MTGRWHLFAVLVWLATSACIAQQTTSTQQPGAAVAQSPAAQTAAATNPDYAIRGAFPASLMKGVDSKKLKDGDPITCKTVAELHSRSGMTIPIGSKVIGHITQAQARSKGDPGSSLGMAFDKIQLPNGKEVAMKGVLQALAPGAANSGPDTGAAGGGTIGNGRGANLSTMPPPSQGSITGPNSGVHPIDSGSRPLLTADSKGVLGFPNLQMEKEGVLTTTGKEVKLDTGTQMLIRAEIQAPIE